MECGIIGWGILWKGSVVVLFGLLGERRRQLGEVTDEASIYVSYSEDG